MPFGKEKGREGNKKLASCLFSPWLGSPDPGLPSTVPSSPAHSTAWLCHTSSPMSTCSFHFLSYVQPNVHLFLPFLSVLEFGNQSVIPFDCSSVTHPDGSLVTVISLPQAQAQMPIPLAVPPPSALKVKSHVTWSPCDIPLENHELSCFSQPCYLLQSVWSHSHTQ